MHAIKIAIHKTGDYGAYDDSYREHWVSALDRLGANHCFVDLFRPDWKTQLSDCDGLLWRPGHSPHDRLWGMRILKTIADYLKITTFPTIEDYWHYDEKLTQAYLFDALQVPTPDIWVFSELANAMQWADMASYPVVFKLSCGAGSTAVRLVENRQQAKALIQRMFSHGIFPDGIDRQSPPLHRRILSAMKRWFEPVGPPPGREHWHWYGPQAGYAMFQEFIPDNPYDTRITIIGDRAFGFRRMNRPGDFRASGSGLIDYTSEKIDPRAVSLAFDTSKKLNSTCMSYDILFKGDKPVIVEMSYTFLDRAVYECPGYWKSDMSWVAEHTWPQDAQVEDLLTRINNTKQHNAIT